MDTDQHGFEEGVREIRESRESGSGSAWTPRPTLNRENDFQPRMDTDRHEWEEGTELLRELRETIAKFVVLPAHGGEALALWVLHTYAFELRKVATYVGIASPEKRCGKTTLMEVLSELVHRPIPAANISPSALFRVIEEKRPTLLIDEADTFLDGNDEMRGILNSGYNRKGAYVMRVSQTRNAEDVMRNETEGDEYENGSAGMPRPTGSRLVRFSTWCPKAIAAIGRLPETLADRCIVITMQRKRPDEACERLRELDGLDLRQRCGRFVREREVEIAKARPTIPEALNDRAGDIWEPLFALADLAGGEWPELARQAAVALSGSAQEVSSPASWLFGDIRVVFDACNDVRLFSRDMVGVLNGLGDRPWREMRRGKPVTEMWLAMQLRAYGIRPKTIWIGSESAKGYERADFEEAFSRYVPAGAGSSKSQAPSSKEAPTSNGDETTKRTETDEPANHANNANETKVQAQFAMLMERLLTAANKPVAEEKAEYDI